MHKLYHLLFIALFFVFYSCEEKEIQFFSADNAQIFYSGRVDLTNDEAPVLIGSASFVEVNFAGDSCIVLLEKQNPEGEYNFVSIEVDNEYQGRIKLEKKGMNSYTIPVNSAIKNHRLRIFKSTEASNNTIVFGGLKCNVLLPLSEQSTRKIEFIGNSITCGMGIDWKEIPCGTGVWYDQHNAYFSYGRRAAEALNAQFMLSSVSGIGIYRNWNSLSPVMPDVYENKYLNTDSSKKWDFDSFTPNLVSICLGTNDFSDGDGSTERLPFDSLRFVNNYIQLIETIYSHYPETQICLLTSPMVSGEHAKLFENCLTAVKSRFRSVRPSAKEIQLYFFSDLVPHGCDSHPDKEDHKIMAELLVPFYKEVMSWE